MAASWAEQPFRQLRPFLFRGHRRRQSCGCRSNGAGADDERTSAEAGSQVPCLQSPRLDCDPTAGTSRPLRNRSADGRAIRVISLYFATEVDGLMRRRVQTSAVVQRRTRQGATFSGLRSRPCKRLKGKEKASTVSLKFLSAQDSAIPHKTIKRNSINMLAHRFCIAPMMDGTLRAGK
jgi:hypothetical protein